MNFFSKYRSIHYENIFTKRSVPMVRARVVLIAKSGKYAITFKSAKFNIM